MANGGPSRLWQVVKLAVVLLIVGPLLVRWGFVGANFVPRVGPGLLPTLDSALLVRLMGLGIVLLVALLLVQQKRRSRGQQGSEDAPEQASDRRVERTEEVYDNQQEARREAERIQERADRITEWEREARERR